MMPGPPVDVRDRNARVEREMPAACLGSICGSVAGLQRRCPAFYVPERCLRDITPNPV